MGSEINYAPPLNSSATENTYVFFAQDNWQLHPRFALDLGVRTEHDSLSSDSVYAAPRIGFVFAPTRDERTAIRGGVGIFYDKIPLNIAAFPEIPAQTITQFAPDGISIVQPATTYTQRHRHSQRSITRSR